MNLEEMVYRVRPHVEGCPEPVIVDELRLACEELCRESHVWQEQLVSEPLFAGISQYRLPAPADTRLVSVQRVELNDETLEYKRVPELERMFGRDWREKTSSPQFWLMEEPFTIRVVPIPSSDFNDGLAVWASLEPSNVWVELPDWFRQYDRVLAEGALATLKEIPGKGWFDPKIAQMHRRRFNTEVANVRYDVSRRFTDQPVRTQAYPR